MPSLLDLPNELLVEIVKNYPPLYAYDVDALVAGVRSRQSSGPWLRDRASTVADLPQAADSRGKMLEHRMRGILSTAYVVPYIHSLSVNLAECSMDNAQPVIHFIRVLRLLPDLQTLTILGVLKTMENVFIALCEDFSFPSVATLAIPGALTPILHCFPNLRALTNAPDDRVHFCNGAEFLGATGRSEQIDTVNNVNLSRHMGEWLRKTTPNLRSLMVCMNGKLPGFYSQSLEGMRDLSEVRVQWSCNREGQPAYLLYLIESGKKILKTSKAFGRKELCFEQINPHQHTVEHATRFTLTGDEWITVPDFSTQLFD
ncbi:hypothetical protein DFH06DRAFT_1311056 [Mycena polygramma]|nr:hypothetical protein DFH06DRAFT_1311056 [Mycena polygramma]